MFVATSTNRMAIGRLGNEIAIKGILAMIPCEKESQTRPITLLVAQSTYMWFTEALTTSVFICHSRMTSVCAVFDFRQHLRDTHGEVF